MLNNFSYYFSSDWYKVAVVGPNGVGKSTFLKLLIRTETPVMLICQGLNSFGIWIVINCISSVILFRLVVRQERITDWYVKYLLHTYNFCSILRDIFCHYLENRKIWSTFRRAVEPGRIPCWISACEFNTYLHSNLLPMYRNIYDFSVWIL